MAPRARQSLGAADSAAGKAAACQSSARAAARQVRSGLEPILRADRPGLEEPGSRQVCRRAAGVRRRAGLRSRQWSARRKAWTARAWRPRSRRRVQQLRHILGNRLGAPSSPRACFCGKGGIPRTPPCNQSGNPLRRWRLRVGVLLVGVQEDRQGKREDPIRIRFRGPGIAQGHGLGGFVVVHHRVGVRCNPPIGLGDLVAGAAWPRSAPQWPSGPRATAAVVQWSASCRPPWPHSPLPRKASKTQPGTPPCPRLL